MAQFTKKAIIEAFYRLLSEKPLDKITVKEIIEECSVTRNTFDYYYSDVYELFAEELRTAVEKIVNDRQLALEPDEFTIKLIGEAVKNKKMIKNIYASRDKFCLEKYISEAVEYIVSNTVANCAAGSSRSGEDLRLICKLLTYTVIGAVNEYMNGRMKDLSEDDLRRMLALFHENILKLLNDNEKKD